MIRRLWARIRHRWEAWLTDPYDDLDAVDRRIPYTWRGPKQEPVDGAR